MKKNQTSWNLRTYQKKVSFSNTAQLQKNTGNKKQQMIAQVHTGGQNTVETHEPLSPESVQYSLYYTFYQQADDTNLKAESEEGLNNSLLMRVKRRVEKLA